MNKEGKSTDVRDSPRSVQLLCGGAAFQSQTWLVPKFKVFLPYHPPSVVKEAKIEFSS